MDAEGRLIYVCMRLHWMPEGGGVLRGGVSGACVGRVRGVGCCEVWCGGCLGVSELCAGACVGCV